MNGPKLMPVDEGSNDPSLSTFRKELLDVVRRRDAAALLKIVNPNVRTGFGPEGGIADFRAQWKPEDPKSPLWDELQDILKREEEQEPWTRVTTTDGRSGWVESKRAVPSATAPDSRRKAKRGSWTLS